MNGLVLESRKRREHLSEEDILRNKAIMESLSKGGGISEQNFEVIKKILCSNLIYKPLIVATFYSVDYAAD